MNKLELKVIKHPTKKGYAILHNQPIGWSGTLKQHFGWYKYKSDAENRTKELTK